MKGLLIKDIKLIAKQKKLLIMSLAMGLMLALTTDDVSYAGVYIVLMMSMTALTTLSYDEMNGGMIFLLSMPTGRKAYAKEKYVLAIGTLITGLIVSLLVSVAISMANGSATNTGDLISQICGMLVGTSVILWLSIPLEIKYGSQKGRIIMMSVIVCVAVVVFGIYKLLTEVLNVNTAEIVAKIMEIVPKDELQAKMFIGVVLVALVCVMMSISYAVTLRIINKKEY